MIVVPLGFKRMWASQHAMVPAWRVLIVRRRTSFLSRRRAALALPNAPIAPSSTATPYLHLAAVEGRRSRRQNYAIPLSKL